MVYLFPENDPGGTIGRELHNMAASAHEILGSHVEASDHVVFIGAEHGEYVDPDPFVVGSVRQVEGDLNALGAAAREMDDIWRWVIDMTPEQFELAKPQLEANFSNIDWAQHYEKYRLCEPGRISRLLRPVLRVLGIEPPYWR